MATLQIRKNIPIIMKRKVYHLYDKQNDKHSYYNSLTALCKDNTDLGVSKFTLDRYDWDLLNWEYENLICIIRLGFSKSVSDVGKCIAQQFYESNPMEMDFNNK